MGPMARGSDGDNSWQAEWHQLLAHPTRLAIIEALRQQPRQITELAEAAAVHPNTVRSHLNRLQNAGALEVETLRHGGRGRPTKQYRLREPVTAAPMPSMAITQLLMKVIVALAQRANDQSAHGQSAVDVATEEGFRVGRELGERFVPADSAPHSWMVELLDHLSFAPQVRHGQGRTEVDLLQCPLLARPDEENAEVVCSFHEGLLKGAANSAGQDPRSVELTPFVGPACCRVTIATSP